MKRVIAALSTILFLAGCKSMNTTPSGPISKAPLLGIIHDSNGFPLSDAAITADESKTAVSDINGRFVLPDIALGGHSFSIKKEGYETVQTDLYFSTPAQTIYTTLISFDDLLEKIVAALKDADSATSKNLILRAEGINANSPRLKYLKVLLFVKTEKYQEAIAGIEELINRYPGSKDLLLTEEEIKNLQGETHEH